MYSDVLVRQRIDEFLDLFLEHGARLIDLRDPLCAVSLGAALSAPFISVIELMEARLPATTALEAVAAQGSPRARAALLALSAATDGSLQALAEKTAAAMGARIPEPPWARAARQPVGECRIEALGDPHDPEARALLVSVEQAGYRGTFFMYFYTRSLITAQIFYLPKYDRETVLAEVAAGSAMTGRHRFLRVDDMTAAQHIDLVNAILVENELNLRMGTSYPLYPPKLATVRYLDEVTVVPAQLVLLRKFVASAAGLSQWPFDDDNPIIWV